MCISDAQARDKVCSVTFAWGTAFSFRILAKRCSCELSMRFSIAKTRTEPFPVWLCGIFPVNSRVKLPFHFACAGSLKVWVVRSCLSTFRLRRLGLHRSVLKLLGGNFFVNSRISGLWMALVEIMLDSFIRGLSMILRTSLAEDFLEILLREVLT